MPVETFASGTATTSNARFDPQPEWNTLHFSLSARRQRFASAKRVATCIPLRSEHSIQPLALLTSGLNKFIAFELGLVREVEYVFTAFRNNVFHVWIVLDPFESEVRERIYEREKAIIDEFPMFEFDFYIIARMGRDVKELISESIELVYDRFRKA